ncbi:hypothetical protein L6164_009239 [Bauhinia variegata]|uniref:Uncharacterized protein n=1 Tax=Bauhinia variegata TaxID=167791 RepID=A0ACB9PM11_BAUVA|nr:hypothetical protein L6164_009239 [Bauhinia variegata]
MGSALEFGIRMRKLLIMSTRACYRSVCNHPFLVAFLCFLIIVYGSFPFLFSILVSASPVLVCTAVLLGTLLSFGHANIPEVEKEEKVIHDFSPFQTGLSEGATVIAERGEDFVVERYTEKGSAIEERGIEEASFGEDKGDKVEEGDGLFSYAPLVDEQSEKIQHEKQVSEGKGREFPSLELEKKREVHQEKLKVEGVSSDEKADEEEYVFVQKVHDDIIDIGDEKTPEEPVDAFEEEHLEFSPTSSWKQVENNDEKEDSLESGSDQAESSSPDASMADIIPRLDELHPLLDTEAPQPAHLSRDVSGGASEMSQKRKDDSAESDEDAESQGELEEDGADVPDDEEEEEMEAGKEDDSKSAIKWTEDDQKSLLDLGNLELERNRHLENLIARRRATKNLSMITEMNLIDLESADLSLNVTPISTTRRNPFDLPDDSYAGMGLPPIPGSAPPILQPRQNPFDTPYDSNEEKPDLKGDSFQQEFTMFNQKDAFFPRHGSFNLGPSVLGINRQERHDISWKPVFVPERMASEGTGYSSFQRASSEASDSRLSSVPDTESVSSIDQDDSKLNEDLSQETDLVSNPDHVSVRVEHGSPSSGEMDSVDMMQAEGSIAGHDEVEIVLGGVENPFETELCSEAGEAVINKEPNTGEIDLRTVPVDEESNGRSSQSSLSEVIDNIPDEKLAKSANFQHGESHLQESRISTQASVEESDLHSVSGEIEDLQQREPVYDSSPSAAEMVTNFSSLAEFSSRDYPPASVEMTSNVTDKESEVHDQRVVDNASGHEEMPSASSQQPTEVNNDLNSLSSNIESVKGVTNAGFVHEQDQADCVHADSEILLKEKVDAPASHYHMASENSQSSDNESVDEVEARHGVDLSTLDDEKISEKVANADEKLDFVVSDAQHMPSSDSSMSDNHYESQKSSIIPEESTQVISTSNNGVEVCDSMHKISLNISSMTSDASETPEFISPSGKVDLADVILEELMDEDQSEVLEQLNLLAEGYGLQFAEENVRGLDEIKEIDEGILSELDTVGDFSISNAGLTRHHDQGISVLEARSMEDIDLTFKQLEEGADINEVILPSMIKDQLVSEESKNHLEANSDLQVVEARSLNDIDTALKQISEGNPGELPKSVDSMDGPVKIEENEVVTEDMSRIADK